MRLARERRRAERHGAVDRRLRLAEGRPGVRVPRREVRQAVAPREVERRRDEPGRLRVDAARRLRGGGGAARRRERRRVVERERHVEHLGAELEREGAVGPAHDARVRLLDLRAGEGAASVEGDEEPSLGPCTGEREEDARPG